MQHPLLLSGAVGAGKTMLSSGLRDRFGARVIKTREFITKPCPRLIGPLAHCKKQATDSTTRLKRHRSRKRSSGSPLKSLSWSSTPSAAVQQVEAVRERFKEVRVQDIHLWASEDVLTASYEGRSQPGDAMTSYAGVRENVTEAEINSLEAACDVLIDTACPVFGTTSSRLSSGAGGEALESPVGRIASGEGAVVALSGTAVAPPRDRHLPRKFHARRLSRTGMRPAANWERHPYGTRPTYALLRDERSQEGIGDDATSGSCTRRAFLMTARESSNANATSVANQLAFALAGVWFRNRRAEPQLVARRVGSRVDISFVVDERVSISVVADRLAELVAELHHFDSA